MKTSSRRCTRRALLGLAGLLLAGCATTYPPNDPPAVGIEIRFLIYSGLPDPAFTLVDGSDTAAFEAKLAAAQPYDDFEGETVTPARLGYSGILVRDEQRRIAVYKGAIELRGPAGGDPRFLADGGALEAWLIDKAIEKKALTDQQLRIVRGD